MRFLRSLLASALVAHGTVVMAGVNSWTPTGAEGGYAFAVAAGPGVMLASTAGAMYRSTDAGQSWTAAGGGGGGVSAIVFDPTNPNRVLACDPNTLWRSDDGGQSFAQVAGPGGSVFKLAAGPDGALYAGQFTGKVFRADSFGAPWVDRSQGLPNELVSDIVVDPQSPNTVYALVQSYGLYKTVDAGVTWSVVAGAPAGSKFAVDPGNSANFLLATNNLLYESRNAGVSWTTSVGQYAWVGFYPAPANGGGAVAVPWKGNVLYRADRNGAWQTGQAVLFSDVRGVVFDSRDPTGRSFVLASSEGPWFTQDSGVAFVIRSHGLRGAGVTALVAANDSAGTIYAAYASGPVGVHRRTAAGWVAADNAALKARAQLWYNTWFQAQAMTVDSGNADVLVISTFGGLVSSADGGQTWAHPQTGPPGIVRALTFDPFDSRTVYAGVDTGGSPAPGVYRSIDGGNVFTLSSTGLSRAVGVLTVDLQTPGSVYAAPFNSTTTAPPLVYRSTDHGATWVPSDTGIALSWINAIAVDPTDSRVVYAGGFGVQPGLAKSADAAQSWHNVGAMNGTPLAFGLAVDPVVPTNVFVSRDSATGAPARSVDGGATWEDLPVARIADPLTNLIILDPLKPSNVIATDDRYGLIEYEVAPDLEVTLPAEPPVVPLGASAFTTVRVTNHGPLAASAVKLTLTAPPSVTAAPAVSQGSCTKVGASFECALGAVRVDQVLDVQLGLTGGNATDSGTLSVAISGHESDPQPANNSLAVALVTDRVSNVGVTLSGASQGVLAQGLLALTATATNSGPNTSSGTEVTFQLSAGLAYQSYYAAQGACTENAGTVTCALGAIAVGALVTATVSATVSKNGTHTAAVQISTQGVDPVATNNADTATIIVNPPATSGGGGGGGGALSVPELLALLVAWAAAARSRAARIRAA